jgi:hypothetical protein
MGHTVAAMYDRTQTGISAGQAGFFKGVILPLYSDLARIFPATAHVHEQAEANLQYWQSLEQ